MSPGQNPTEDSLSDVGPDSVMCSSLNQSRCSGEFQVLIGLGLDHMTPLPPSGPFSLFFLPLPHFHLYMKTFLNIISLCNVRDNTRLHFFKWHRITFLTHRIVFLLDSQEPVLETLVFDNVCDPAPRSPVVLSSKEHFAEVFCRGSLLQMFILL